MNNDHNKEKLIIGIIDNWEYLIFSLQFINKNFQHIFSFLKAKFKALNFGKFWYENHLQQLDTGEKGKQNYQEFGLVI